MSTVYEELARRLQHRRVERDAGLVLGVRLDERVEDGPLLREPVPQHVELHADVIAVVGPEGRPAPAAGHYTVVIAVRPLLLFGADST